MHRKQSTLDLHRKLNRHAPTVMIGGIFLFFSVLLYISLCSSDCYNTSPHSDVHSHHKEEAEEEKPLLFKPAAQRFRHDCYLLVLILTGLKSFERRDVIRQTWLLNHKQLNVCVFFAIGTSKLTESEKQTLDYELSNQGDLLLLPELEDSYKTLSEKVLQSLVWIDHNVKFKFLLKSDDDTYARLDVILKELKEKPTERLYWGFFDGRSKVKRRGKWEEKHWFLSDLYLPYALGGGYVLSGDLVHFVSQNAEYLQLYNSEDISMGTWLAPLNIHRVHDPRFNTEFKSRGCLNEYIVTHKQSSEDMKNLYKNLKDTGLLCQRQFKRRLSYIYNWDVPPSQCCIRNDSAVP